MIFNPNNLVAKWKWLFNSLTAANDINNILIFSVKKCTSIYNYRKNPTVQSNFIQPIFNHLSKTTKWHISPSKASFFIESPSVGMLKKSGNATVTSIILGSGRRGFCPEHSDSLNLQFYIVEALFI